MNSKKMSQQPSDHSSDRSDVLSVLENIRNMFTASRNCLNSFAQEGMFLAIAQEAQMLAMKLNVMAERWRIHIPFKEACGVDFYSWAKEVESMAAYLRSLDNETETEKYDDYCPGKHFLLDLYTLLEKDLDGRKPVLASDGRPYYTESVITAFISRQEQMRKTLTEHWRDYVEEFSELASDALVDTVDTLRREAMRQEEDGTGFGVDIFEHQMVAIREAGGNICFACCAALNLLAEKLHILNERLCGNFRSEHFSRLADRIFLEREYEGRKVATRVRNEVSEWYNGTPEEDIAAGREYDMRDAYDLMANLKFGGKRFDAYVRKFTPDIEQKKSAIGKFLFNSRRSITGQDLKNFMELYFRIYYHRRRQLEEEKSLPEKEEERNDSQPQTSVTPQKETPVSGMASTDSVHTPEPDITAYLSERLASDPAALQRFRQLLDRCEPYICRKMKFKQLHNPEIGIYDGWTWRHLETAFRHHGFIPDALPASEFIRFISTLFHDRKGRTYTGVQKGYYKTNVRNSDEHTQNVIRHFSGVFRE